MSKRPKLVSVVAGWMIVCSVVGVIVFSITIPSVDHIRTQGEGAQWIVDHLGRGGVLAGALAIYLLTGTLGVGLWKLRAWARFAMVLTSSLLVVMALVLGIASMVTAHAFDSSALILTVAFGWPIYYFNLPKIKAAFE